MPNMTTTTTTPKTDATAVAADGIKTVRNFKQNNDIESFYRFVHENGLRREAGLILSKVCDALSITKKKAKRKPRKSKKIQ